MLNYQQPDARGHFGPYGGTFVAETLIHALDELKGAYEHYRRDAEFVAEFELVPRQVGAIVLIGGKIAGIERAPSAAYFRVVWEPLIRVCYGSLAVKVAKVRREPPSTRIALSVTEKTLAGLRRAIEDARRKEQEAIDACLSEARSLALSASDEVDDTLGSIALTTVANPGLAGQVVTVNKAVRYASLCVAA